MFICFLSYGQIVKERGVSVHMDIAELVKDRTIEFGFSHPFNEKWSAGGSISLNIPGRIGKENAKEDEEWEHDKNLSSDKAGTEGSMERPEYRIGLCYWKDSFHEGAHMAFICSHSDRNGASFIIGAGYTIKIWKGMSVDIGYERMIFSIRNETTGRNNGLNLELSFRF